jgi:hypothetical protein
MSQKIFTYIKFLFLFLMLPFLCRGQDTLKLEGSVYFVTRSDDSIRNLRKYSLYGPNLRNYPFNINQVNSTLMLWENKSIHSLSLMFGDGNYESKIMKFYETGLPTLIVSDYKLYNFTTEITYDEGYTLLETVYYDIGKFTKYYDNGFLYSIEEKDTTGLKSGFYYRDSGKLIRSCECKFGKPLNGICTKFTGDFNKNSSDGIWIFEKYKNGVKKREYVVDAEQKIVLNKWTRPKFLNRWIYKNIIDAYLLALEFDSFMDGGILPINNEKSKSQTGQMQENW